MNLRVRRGRAEERVHFYLKNAIKNKYIQAILRGMKPCVIGIVLATGVYMVLKNLIIKNTLYLVI